MTGLFYRGGVAHVFACPLRVLDAGLAGARHAVGHAPRVAARVTVNVYSV